MTRRTSKAGLTGTQLGDPVALAGLVERFAAHFPSFTDPAYEALEPQYKRAAANQMHQLLDKDKLHKQLASGEFPAIKADILQATRGTFNGQQNNLLNMWDVQALDNADPEKLAHRIYRLLYGTDPFPLRFEMWVDALATAKDGVWPAATYFLMLHDSANHIFVKPEPYQKLLNALHSNLAWSTRPTAAAYAQIQAVAQTLFAALHDLGPQDLIDVQSFIYILYPSNLAHALPDA